MKPPAQKYFDYPYGAFAKIRHFPFRYIWKNNCALRVLTGTWLISMFTIVRGYEMFTHSPRLVEKYLQREHTKHFRHFEKPELPKDYVAPPKHY